MKEKSIMVCAIFRFTFPFSFSPCKRPGMLEKTLNFISSFLCLSHQPEQRNITEIYVIFMSETLYITT